MKSNDANNNNNNNEIVVSNSEKYQDASNKFRLAWTEYKGVEDKVKIEIIKMVEILEGEGYSRMNAVKKIIADHKDLKGFSKPTIYRHLPEDMKNKGLGALEEFRKQRGTQQEPSEEDQLLARIPNEDDNERYQQLVEEEEEQPVIYDDPRRMIRQLEEQIKDLIQPFTKNIVVELKDQYIPLIIRVDPVEKDLEWTLDTSELRRLAN